MRLWHVASHRCLSVFTWFTTISSIAFQPRRIRLLGQTPALSDQHAVQQGQALLVIKQPQGRYELGFYQAETQGYAQKEIMDQTIITALLDITHETMNLPQHGALRQRLGALCADWGGSQPQRLAMGDANGVVSFWGLSAELFRDTEQAEVAEVKTQPAQKDENENKKIWPQPSASEWRLLGASRYSGMQLWTQDMQLPDCHMSLMSKRLLQQTGANVSGVIVSDRKSSENEVKKTKISEIEDEKLNIPSSKKPASSIIESKYETDLPKLEPSEPLSTVSLPVSGSTSLSDSQSVSTSSSTSMSSSSTPPSLVATQSTVTPEVSPVSSSSRSSLTVSSSTIAVLTHPSGPSLMSPPRTTTPATTLSPPHQVTSPKSTRLPPPISEEYKQQRSKTPPATSSSSVASSSAFLSPSRLSRQSNSRSILRSTSAEVMSPTSNQNPIPQPPSGARGNTGAAFAMWKSRDSANVSASSSSTTSTTSSNSSSSRVSSTQTTTPTLGGDK